ncbi:hypothetical protein DF186_16585, partial [Enterococcus hirae]
TQGIHGVPTFHFFKNGQQVDEIVGADLSKIEAKLNEVLGSSDSQFENQGGYPTQQGPQFQRKAIRQSGNPYHGHSAGQDQGTPQPYRGG